MPDECSNHGVVTDEQKQAAMQRLADALTLLWDGHVPSGDGVRQELQHAEIFGGVQGLPMDIGVVAFREQSRLARHKIAYTMDWMLQRQAQEIAMQIEEDIRERLSDA
jgi:hypothetical protein